LTFDEADSFQQKKAPKKARTEQSIKELETHHILSSLKAKVSEGLSVIERRNFCCNYGCDFQRFLLKLGLQNAFYTTKTVSSSCLQQGN
jgi:hypothetical protein